MISSCAHRVINFPHYLLPADSWVVQCWGCHLCAYVLLAFVVHSHGLARWQARLHYILLLSPSVACGSTHLLGCTTRRQRWQLGAQLETVSSAHRDYWGCGKDVDCGLVVTPCSLVGGSQHFLGTYYLYLQPSFLWFNRNGNILEYWGQRDIMNCLNLPWLVSKYMLHKSQWRGCSQIWDSF
jgi:hypothetical protein